MSNSERKSNLPAIIQTTQETFTKLARRHNVPDFTFEREMAFALQILKANDYLATVASGNPDSLKEAIINVAAVGLSLSPVHKQAYLVPRKQRVCLDISYQGLVDLATTKGSILWAKAEIVHERDTFEHVGINKEPKHSFNPFGERGPIVGGYCLAKMVSGDLLVDFMSIKEIFTIRDRSEGYRSFKAGKAKSTPWDTDEGEMIKKTLVRRAYKSWPKAMAKDELDRAIDVTNDSDGPDFETLPAATTGPTPHQLEAFVAIRELLEILDRPEEKYIEHLCKTTNRKIEKIEDLTELECDQSVTFLQGLVDAQAKKIAALQSRGSKNENAG